MRGDGAAAAGAEAREVGASRGRLRTLERVRVVCARAGGPGS